MISFRCPWPEYKGGYIVRVLNTAKILSKDYNVDLVTLIENKGQERCLGNLEKIFNKVIFFRQSKIKKYLSIIRAFFLQRPLQVNYYFSKEVKEWIKRNCQNYDLLYFNTIRTADYAENVGVPKVLDLVDAISLNYESAQKWTSSFWKIIYRIEAPRTLRYELDIFKKDIFDNVFISSPFDKKYLEKNIGYPLDNLTVLPNGVREELLKEKLFLKEENWISFFGKMDYQPNIDAVTYFSKKVFPGVKKKIPDIKFYIVGMNPVEKVKELAREKGIEVTGFLRDPYSVLRKSKIIIAPLRFGGGSQYKILESMALKKLVITTSVGMRGIKGTQNGKNLLVVDVKRPLLVIEKIVELLSDPERRMDIGIEAGRLIEKDYTWQRIGKELLMTIEDTVKKY